MRHDLVAALSLALLASAGASAGAAPSVAVPQPCLDDLQRLCPGLAGPALRHCRVENRGAFSAACRQALTERGLKLKDVRLETP